MFLRKTTVKRKNKRYTYVQIVESYRRPSDGMPAVKVLSNLGQLSELDFENLKCAFDASRSGKTLVVKDAGFATDACFFKPKQNLVYLDVAVLFELWKEWGLDEIMSHELFVESQNEVDVGRIIFALVAQRCVDPGSKLSATRWFQTTSLPELLEIKPKSFNNTRIHRSLEKLESAHFSLMSKLTKRYQERGRKFSAMFLDVTDTWFVGHGISLAETGKTKEGMLRRKIGIVLLCNKDGFPVRWDVVPGNQNDSATMMGTIESISTRPWLAGVPLVCDRAMGKSSQIVELSRLGVNFVTALTRTEYATYTTELPLIAQDSKSRQRKQIAAEATQRIRETSWAEVNESLFVKDFGVIKKAIPCSSGVTSVTTTGYVAEAMRLAHKMEQMVAEGEYDSYTAAGSALGLKKGLALRYHWLLRLPRDIQDQIHRGEAESCTIDDLIALTKLSSSDAVTDKFCELLKAPRRRRNPRKLSEKNENDREEFEVRVIGYFNPFLFADRRISAGKKLESVKVFEEDLNARLNSSRKARSPEKIHAEVDRFLRRDGLITAFKTSIKSIELGKRTVQQVKIDIVQDDWAKRRRYDGFNILVTHPGIKLDAPDVCQLYRDKNTVEVDFRTIKSFLDVRPMHHRTDQKVKAHVTVCMLSLLLERTLRKKIGSDFLSTQAALELLRTCHLNRYESGNESLYVVTELEKQQRELLHKLCLTNLADDDAIRERITART